MKIKEVDKKLVLKDGETGTIDIELPKEAKEEIAPKVKASSEKEKIVDDKSEVHAEKENKSSDRKVMPKDAEDDSESAVREPIHGRKTHSGKAFGYKDKLSDINDLSSEEASDSQEHSKHAAKKTHMPAEPEITQKHQSTNELYFDVIMIVSILLYLFSQTEGFEIFGRECEAGTVPYGIFMIISMISLCGPSLVFMKAGAKLLIHNETKRYIWKNRILRMAVLLLIFTIFYYISDLMGGRDDWDIWTFIGDLYCKERIVPLAYMYSYIGFLICLPFLRPMAQNMKNRDFIYLIIIGIILQTVMPEIDDKICEGRYIMNPAFNLNWLLTNSIFYPLVGYYLHHRVTREQIKKVLPFAWLLTVIDMSMIIYNTYYHTTYIESVAIYMDYLYWVGILASLSMFMTIKLIHTGHPHKESVKKVLASIGGCTLGVYLVFPAVLDRIKIFDDLEYMIFGSITGPAKIFPSLLWILIVYLISFIPVWLFRRIPFVKKTM